MGPKNHEIGHISGTAGSYPDLIGPMRSPSGGAYLIILPHPATPPTVPGKIAVLDRNLDFLVFLYTNKGCWGTKMTPNRDFRDFFLWNTYFFRKFLSCGILLPN